MARPVISRFAQLTPIANSKDHLVGGRDIRILDQMLADLRQHLSAGCFYIMDRGFQAYQLLADIREAQSDFLVRLRKSAAVEVLERRPLTAADQAASIISEETVTLG